MKKITNLILVITIACIVIIAGWLGKNYIDNKIILAKCPSYKNPYQKSGIGPGMADKPFLINCSGIMVIYEDDPKFNDFKYRAYDFKNDYAAAYFHDLGKYKIIGDFLYVISEANSSKYNNGYDNKAFINGKLGTISYSGESDFPKFRKINTRNGETILYSNLEKTSEADRDIFQSISK